MANEVRFVIDDLKRQLRDMRERAERAERMYAFIERGLIPLCPCTAGNPADWDGPQRECVVHGDGDTFVAEHRRLKAIEAAAMALYRRSGDTGPALVAFDAEIEQITR
jgi:hypothetical protein